MPIMSPSFLSSCIVLGLSSPSSPNTSTSQFYLVLVSLNFKYLLFSFLGRTLTWLLGGALGAGAAIWVNFGDREDEFFINYALYIVAVLYGAGSSVLLITRYCND